jgi:glycosyltransferase involved in cell wall biosynthesis
VSSALVSVIIPVYNAQKALAACLDSVLSQSYRDLQIILVNDGSKDSSLAICRQYAMRDERIQVIDQTNGGPGAARNAALKAARGTYLQFLDSDDTVPADATAALVDGMPGEDLVIGHFTIGAEEKSSRRGLIKPDCRLDKLGFMQEHIKWPGSYYFSALWNKLYLRRIVEEHSIRFDERMVWGEDSLFNMQYYLHVKRVHCIPRVVYHYYRAPGGLSWRSTFNLHKGITIKRKIFQALRALYHQEGLLRKYGLRVNIYLLNITLKD